MKELKFWAVCFCVLFALWPVYRFALAWYWLHKASIVFSTVPQPGRVAAPVMSAVHDATAILQREQQAQFAKIRADALRRKGLLPPRALRESEICSGGTVVAVSKVAGIPTYVQVLEGGLRVSCAD